MLPGSSVVGAWLRKLGKFVYPTLPVCSKLAKVRLPYIVCAFRMRHNKPLVPTIIYTTTIGEPSSTFDEFLACVRNSTAIMASIFLRLHLANPRPLCDRFLRFIVLCFLRKK